MKLTKEQEAIIGSSGNIKVNAVAGSGKTTTIIEYAKTRPRDSKILYLAFNKSVKTEAIRRFAEEGLLNVDVHTAHSLAFRQVVRNSNYTLNKGYKVYELAKLLKINGGSGSIDSFIIADHVLKFASYFCNSNASKVTDLDYRTTISDPKIKGYVDHNYEQILRCTRLFLAKMDKAEIEITHDFYLKKFQLSNPKLKYDFILFDEAQDASGAMLDVFLNQQATLVMVGDTNQQIYGWRYAVNSLDKVQFPVYHLTQSFRFSESIAELASRVLSLKKRLSSSPIPPIEGKGTSTSHTIQATIARTNLGLLVKAIDYVAETKKGNGIYFEGELHSYTYAGEGASLYDVLNLFNEKHDRIKDVMIRSMKTFEDLKEYISKTDDKELGMMVSLVEDYENEIYGIIKELKERNLSAEDKMKAKMIFSTVHRCKGMEYDTVILANDFIDEKVLQRELEDPEIDSLKMEKLGEEINLLYVAVTRTKNALSIPGRITPIGFEATSQITILEDENSSEKSKKESSKTSQKESPWKSRLDSSKKTNQRESPWKSRLEPSKKTSREFSKSTSRSNTPDYDPAFESYMTAIKKEKPSAYSPWTEELDAMLEEAYCEGQTVAELSTTFERTHGAIRSRIKKLELELKYG
jgi:F-box protein 18 (helicase)